MRKTILCITTLVETSPQALPLGAACIYSAINNSLEIKDFFLQSFLISLLKIM